jgi:hypothetical protein
MAQKNKKKNRLSKILLTTLVALIAVAGAIAFWQRDNIGAFVASRQHSAEELEAMLAENELATDAIIERLPIAVRPLTPEEREQVANGELTESDIAARILNRAQPPATATAQATESGETGGAPQASAAQGATAQAASTVAEPRSAEATAAQQAEPSEPEAPEPETPELSPESEAETRIAELVAQIYVLRETMAGQLEQILNSAKAEYKALPEEQQTAAKRGELATHYLNKGASLEAQCDGKIAAILGELEPLIADAGGDEGVISEIMSAYRAEKSIKKSYYMNLYS